MISSRTVNELIHLANVAQTELSRPQVHGLDTSRAQRHVDGALYELAEAAPRAILRDIRAELAEANHVTVTERNCGGDCRYCAEQELTSDTALRATA